MSERLVLDASAILCLLNDEEGSATVAGALARATISAVNVSEVAAKLTDYGMDPASVQAALAPLHLDIVSFDAEQAVAAGVLRRSTRSAGLSFGDRACLALAKLKDARALTSDRSWAAVGLLAGIDVQLLR